MRQANIFLETEGDRWFERNRAGLGVRDPVADMIDTLKIKPHRVLEIGCADGWRLAAMRDKYGCDILGVEPSRQACMEAANRRVPAIQSSAAVLPVEGVFDLVIYGFCLYLTDPGEWLRIAGEGDTALRTGGHIIIHDFAATRQPFARVYKHRASILAYHFDFAALWLGNPLYEMVHRTVIDDEMVTTLRKSPLSSIKVQP